MKIGKTTQVQSAICTSDEHSITVRGHDLCGELIGHIGFADYFHLLLTGKKPTPAASRVLEATLVAITEHGLVPSVQAARMTFAAAPDALQGAVAAGILGCGSVILGASADAGRMLVEIDKLARSEGGAQSGAQGRAESNLQTAAKTIVSRLRAAKLAIPGYGHPQHKERDPRVARLFELSLHVGGGQRFVHVAEAVEAVLPEVMGRELKLNVSAAIPAVLLGVDFPVAALRGVPILARTAGLIAHLAEEVETPIGFALSYQAAREQLYTGEASKP